MVAPRKLSTMLWRLIGGELYKADLEIKNLGLISVHNFSSMIIDVLKSNEDRWDSDGNLEKLISKIEGTSSIKELIFILDKRYYNEDYS